MVDFKTISIRGRIAYGIMCAESYALARFPERDWKPLFQVLWGISQDDVYWDEWASDIIDRLPETVFSDDPRDHEETDPAVLERYRALYQGMPDTFNRILSDIVDIEEADAYTIVEGHGAEALECLLDIINVMREEGVALPDTEAVVSMTFEGDGRGSAFDARRLSQVL